MSLSAAGIDAGCLTIRGSRETFYIYVLYAMYIFDLTTTLNLCLNIEQFICKLFVITCYFGSERDRDLNEWFLGQQEFDYNLARGEPLPRGIY